MKPGQITGVELMSVEKFLQFYREKITKELLFTGDMNDFLSGSKMMEFLGKVVKEFEYKHVVWRKEKE